MRGDHGRSSRHPVSTTEDLPVPVNIRSLLRLLVAFVVTVASAMAAYPIVADRLAPDPSPAATAPGAPRTAAPLFAPARGASAPRVRPAAVPGPGLAAVAAPVLAGRALETETTASRRSEPPARKRGG